MQDIKVLDPQPNINGVKPEVAEGIAKMLRNGRRYFGSSGAGLTQQMYNPQYADSGIKPELAKIGLEGERDTTKFLQRWMKDKPGVVLVDSVHIHGLGKDNEINEETGLYEGGDTDHVMLIGSEVILIDTKRWKKKRTYTVGDKGEVLRANKQFPGGNVHMRQAVHMWVDYLEAGAAITGIVCINSEEITVIRTRNWYTQNYRVVEIDRMQELLDGKWDDISDYDKTHINSTFVSQVAVGAQKPFDPYEKVFSKEALTTFK